MSQRDAILAELNQLAKKKKRVNPHDVIAFAKNPKTALHDCFTWDDGEAAERWRLHEARNLIRVMVAVEPNTGETYRAFVSLRGDRNETGGYRPLLSVMEHKDLRATLIAEVLADMRAFRLRYKELAELSQVFVAMEKAAQELQEPAKSLAR